MKRNRWIVISIIVINIGIIAACIFLLMGEDRIAPELSFQPSDYTYLRSDGESLLLQNIIAYDNRDGDITNRIVIEKLTENQDSNTVVVYYAVSDLAGNVAKVSRIFPMEPSDKVPEYVAAKQEETESGKGETGEADKTEEENGSDQESETEDAVDGESEEPEDENGGEEQEDENGGEEQEDEEQEDERIEEEPPEPAKPVVDKSGYPVLTLKKKEVTIEAGTSPPWTELIETMRDDKDDYTTLYYNLHISKLTAGKAGDYPVTLQAEDSDGNLSDPVTITVHVR